MADEKCSRSLYFGSISKGHLPFFHHGVEQGLLALVGTRPLGYGAKFVEVHVRATKYEQTVVAAAAVGAYEQSTPEAKERLSANKAISGATRCTFVVFSKSAPTW